MGEAVAGNRGADDAAGAGEGMSILDWLPWRRARETDELSNELRTSISTWRLPTASHEANRPKSALAKRTA